MKKELGQSSYKFKYTYLVLAIIFVLLILTTYLLPNKLPQIFFGDSWVVVPNNNVNNMEVSIEYVPQSMAMTVLGIVRDIATSGFIGVMLYAFYEYRFAKDAEQTLIDNVNNILLKNIKSSVIHALYTDRDISFQMLEPEWIDEILNTCLIRKTGDEGKANAVMKLLVENVINQHRTIEDLDVSMTLEDFSDQEKRYCAYSTYLMTYVIRYKVFLETDDFMFMLTNDRNLQSDNLGVFSFSLFVDSAFSGKEVYFAINQITIDGIPLTLQRKRENGNNFVKEQYWNTCCNDKRGKWVQVVYSVKFLIRKRSNHFSYFTPAMTNNIHLRFDASKTDIKRIKLLPYFNSKEKPTILLGEDENNPKVIEITLNDWTLPSSGAAFIWQFEKR